MKEKSTRINLLQKTDVATALIKLGIPTMIGMLISALYNAIDAFFCRGPGDQPDGCRVGGISNCPDRNWTGDDVRSRCFFLYLTFTWKR